jgi:hypothetical protein
MAGTDLVVLVRLWWNSGSENKGRLIKRNERFIHVVASWQVVGLGYSLLAVMARW